jgi:molecular chaperone DnaK
VSDLVVGIDLGTTNSLVGCVIEGKTALFADATGAELLPSVVGIDPAGAVLVGRAAKNRRLLDPAGTVVSVKRLMGQDTRVRVGSRELTPPQVSALILAALLDRVEQKIGARPARAVITVPAFFDDVQRQATRTAGELAGLEVDRLVNEPTAAALTYQSGQEESVLVYDLGGGTFDVSVLERDEGFLEVKASRGDTHLGGDDLDRDLVRLVLDRLGGPRGLVEKDPRAMTRLTEAVERAKIALSERDEVRLFDPFVAGEGADAVHLDMPLTREDVEAVARPMLERTLRCIDDALGDAKMQARDVHRVLLVGGVSKMPIVARMVSAHLSRPVQVDANADRAVALGAAMLAGRAAGAAIDEILVDITPHTLSVGVAHSPDEDFEEEGDLHAAPVIRRDTVVPVERTNTYFTMVEDQQAVAVPIAQGEAEWIGDNTWLGRVVVRDLPRSPAGSPVEVTFRLDLSGVLHVSAKHVPSGCVAAVTIAESPHRLTEQMRKAARAEVEAMRASPPAQPDPTAASEADLSLARALIGRAERALEKAPDGDPLVRDKIAAAMAELSEAAEARSERTSELIDKLSDALLDLT